MIPPDVVERELRESAVLVPAEDILAVLVKDWLTCMTVAVVADQRFGMKVAVLP